jgi:ATP-dependent HslUV protease ATP-binding subunit HslU
LPELQGRLPIRVELQALTREDFRRILTEPEASLIKQYEALMATEGLTLTFEESAIDALADVAVQVNSTVENIGARRLQTVMERVLDEISFNASEKSGETISIDGAYVEDRIGDLASNTDSRTLLPNASDRSQSSSRARSRHANSYVGAGACSGQPQRSDRPLSAHI